MESADFLPDDSDSSGEPEISEEVVQTIRGGVATAIAEQRAAETVNNLVRTPWLLDRVIDKALSSIEQQGLVLDGLERSVSGIITESIMELLPEGQEDQRHNPDDQGEGSDSSGVREPRKPIPPSLLGNIALDMPHGSA